MLMRVKRDGCLADGKVAVVATALLSRSMGETSLWSRQDLRIFADLVSILRAGVRLFCQGLEPFESTRFGLHSVSNVVL